MKRLEWGSRGTVCVAGGHVAIYEVRQAAVCSSHGQDVKAGTSGEQAVSVSERGCHLHAMADLLLSVLSE
jgi:hypothetical protein